MTMKCPHNNGADKNNQGNRYKQTPENSYKQTSEKNKPG